MTFGVELNRASTVASSSGRNLVQPQYFFGRWYDRTCGPKRTMRGYLVLFDQLNYGLKSQCRLCRAKGCRDIVSRQTELLEGIPLGLFD